MHWSRLLRTASRRCCRRVENGAIRVIAAAEQYRHRQYGFDTGRPHGSASILFGRFQNIDSAGHLDAAAVRWHPTARDYFAINRLDYDAAGAE